MSEACRRTCPSDADTKTELNAGMNSEQPLGELVEQLEQLHEGTGSPA
jgi:hypothetical protein